MEPEPRITSHDVGHDPEADKGAHAQLSTEDQAIERAVVRKLDRNVLVLLLVLCKLSNVLLTKY